MRYDRGETLMWMGTSPQCHGSPGDCHAHHMEFVCASHDGCDFPNDYPEYGGCCDSSWTNSGQKALCTKGTRVPVKPPQGTETSEFGCVVHAKEGDTPILSIMEQVDHGPVAAGRYRLAWKYPGPTTKHPTYVNIEMFEVDDVSDDNCGQVWTEEYGYGMIPYGYTQGEWVQVTVNLRNIANNGCSKEVTFPEYQFRLVEDGEDRSCTLGKYPPDGGNGEHELRLLSGTQLSLTKKMKEKNIDWHGEFAATSDGGHTVRFKYDIECKGCGVDLSGNFHIITRTSNMFPFEEAWAMTDPTLKAEIDFSAVLQAGYSYENTKEIVPGICALPFCLGATMAGVGVTLGLVPSLDATLNFDFDAKLTLKYHRQIEVAGTFAGHALRKGGANFDFTKTVTGFDPIVKTLDDGNEPAKEGWALDLDAMIQLTVSPHLAVGLFSSAGDVLSAEAGITATLNLAGNMAFAARLGQGNVIAPLAMGNGDSCPFLDNPEGKCCAESGLPLCVNKDICAQDHRIQLDFNAYAEAIFEMKLAAAADFGFWDTEFVVAKYFTLDGLADPGPDDAPVPFYRKDLKIASVCLEPAGHHSHTPHTHTPHQHHRHSPHKHFNLFGGEKN